MMNTKYKKILLQLIGVVFFFQLIRIVFFAVNHTLFQINGVGDYLKHAFYSLRFDVSAAFTINILYLFFAFMPFAFVSKEWVQKILFFFFIISNTIVFLFDISDIAYFAFERKRMTLDVFHLLGRKSDFINLIPSYIVSFWYVLPLVFCLVILFIFINKRIEKKFKTQGQSDGTHFRFLDLLIWIVSIGISIIAIRGGFQLKPILANTALLYTSSQNSSLILNTPFSIIHSYELGEPLQPLHYFSEKELKAYFNPVKNYSSNKPVQKSNIVLIVLESFGKVYTEAGGRVSYTPFLDSLAHNGLSFTQSFANAYTSAMGIPACVAGIPAFMNSDFTTSPYSNNKIDALPSLLQQIGYSTSFFHGGTNGTMGFDIFTKNAGFEKYYGRNEFQNDAFYDGAWGIWDEPFLQFFAKQLNEQKQPFFSTIFTLSSHEPFQIPKEYKHESFAKLQGIYKGVSYTDMSLKKYFDAVSKMPWFQNTLFVITADHNFLSCRDSLNYYNQGIGMFSIPMIFYKPNDATIHGVDSTVFQQINILPTIMDYIHYPKSFFALGESGFDKHKNNFCYCMLDHNKYFRFNDLVVAENATKIDGVYHFKQDSLLKNNLMQYGNYDSIINYYKAYQQMLHHALIQNKMSVQ